VTQQGYFMKKNGAKIELFDNIKGLFGKKPPAAAATAVAAPTKPANSNKK
jgi:YidC/Oxa1 family membrane protein insertase